jgi:hypothetical protein
MLRKGLSLRGLLFILEWNNKESPLSYDPQERGHLGHAIVCCSVACFVSLNLGASRNVRDLKKHLLAKRLGDSDHIVGSL